MPPIRKFTRFTDICHTQRIKINNCGDHFCLRFLRPMQRHQTNWHSSQLLMFAGICGNYVALFYLKKFINITLHNNNVRASCRLYRLRIQGCRVTRWDGNNTCTNNKSSHNIVWEHRRRRSGWSGSLPKIGRGSVMTTYTQSSCLLCAFFSVIYECYVQSSIEFRVLKLEYRV